MVELEGDDGLGVRRAWFEDGLYPCYVLLPAGGVGTACGDARQLCGVRTARLRWNLALDAMEIVDTASR